MGGEKRQVHILLQKVDSISANGGRIKTEAPYQQTTKAISRLIGERKQKSLISACAHEHFCVDHLSEAKALLLAVIPTKITSLTEPLPRTR